MTIPEQEQPAQPQQSDKEFNFGQLRKQLEQERSARMQLEQDLAKQMEDMKARQKPPHEDEEEDNEPYVDRKTLNKVISRTMNEVDNKIEKKATEKAHALMAEERRSSFIRNTPDFKEILSPEMLQKFADKLPEAAEAFLEMPDTFERQKLLYQTIKAAGLHKKEEAKPSIQDTIDGNRKNIYYQPTSIGSPPYQAAGDFSDVGQKSAYQKMQALINKRKAF